MGTTDGRVVEMSRERVEEVGSCNGCRVRTETVVEVRLRVLAFRLCPACESVLRGLLTAPADDSCPFEPGTVKRGVVGLYGREHDPARTT